jgi:hypothetical protein
LDRDTFRDNVKLAKHDDVDIFQGRKLVYDQQHPPAAQWFAERGWAAEETTLMDYLKTVGRSVESADAEAANMLASITLVSAVKR